MAKQLYSRFWNRRFIVSLIGIDYTILEKSEHNNLPKFYLASFVVLGILCISFCSIFYAFELMFEMWHAEILLSSFFSLMFFTIYIFLIQTFSKEVFPTTSKLKFFNLSNLSRIGFVLMIGFLIAQPIKILVYRHQLNNDITQYKNALYLKFSKINQKLYDKDIQRLQNDKYTYQLMPKSSVIQSEIDKINKAIIDIKEQESSANIKAYHSILTSNFFIKRIEISSQYSGSSLIVFGIVLLFFTPIALIYSISGKSKYYELKKYNDKNLVEAQYFKFKSKYTLMFKEKYKLNTIYFHEPFLDPPFNTIRKPLPNYLSQEDFFNHLIR